MPEILHQLIIDVPPSATFDAITEQKGLSSWWTTDVKAEPTVGSIAEFGFNERAVVFDMRIVALDKPNFIRWHCLAGHPGEFSDGILAQCSYDWARYLTSLKSYLETGTGSPHGLVTAN